MAEFLRAQAAWRLARAGSDPVRAARCAAALLDAAAFVVTLTEDDEDLAALARAGCFGGGEVFDPGARGLQIARWWQFGEPPYAGPRDLLAALAAAALATTSGRTTATAAGRTAATTSGRTAATTSGRTVARSGPAAP